MPIAVVIQGQAFRVLYLILPRFRTNRYVIGVFFGITLLLVVPPTSNMATSIFTEAHWKSLEKLIENLMARSDCGKCYCALSYMVQWTEHTG